MASLDDNLDVRRIAFVAFSIVLVIAILIIGLLALYKAAENREFKNKVVDRPPREYTELRLEQQGELNSYKWVDRQAGVAAVPIDRAMEIVARENRGAFGGPMPAQEAPADTATGTQPTAPADDAGSARSATGTQSAPAGQSGADQETAESIQ